MSRAVNRKGWGTQPTPPTTQAQLTALVPYSQMFIPARAMSPGNNSSTPTFLEYNFGAREIGVGVWVFDKATPGKMVSFDIDLHGSQVDLSDPQFIIYPVFFQDNDDVVTGLEIELGVQCACRLIGDTFDMNYDPSLAASTEITMPVSDRWLNSGGDVSDIRTGAKIHTINGSTPQQNQNNTFIFSIDRESCILQWKNDFTKTAQIPNVTT